MSYHKLHLIFMIIIPFYSLEIQAEDWGSCVKQKQLEYIDRDKDGWRNAKYRAMAYCDIKSPKSTERIEFERLQREAELQEKKSEEVQRRLQFEHELKKAWKAKEQERKKQYQDEKRLYEVNISLGEPKLYPKMQVGFRTGGREIRQEITVKRKSERTRNVTIGCEGTALIKSRDPINNRVTEKYDNIRASVDIVFSMKNDVSKSELIWTYYPLILSIQNFEYKCEPRIPLFNWRY